MEEDFHNSTQKADEQNKNLCSSSAFIKMLLFSLNSQLETTDPPLMFDSSEFFRLIWNHLKKKGSWNETLVSQ